MSNIITARTIETVETELRVLQEQTQRAVLGYAIEAGRRLEEAKEMLGHGQWGGWLERMGYSQSTANNLMRIFREYGANQQSLFGGEANSQALGNLTYTKALRLLALPDAEEREKFVAEHDVAAMSTRELDRALKERDEALRRAEQAEAAADEFREEAAKAQAYAHATEESMEKMEADVRMLKKAGKDASEMEKKLLMAKTALKGQQEEAATLREDANKLRQELKELRERPVDVAVEVREPTPEELAKLTAEAVEQARTEDARRVRELEKQLAQADPDTAEFKAMFNNWQKAYQDMMDCLDQISGRAPEKVGKFRNAVKASAEGMVAECGR